MLLLWLQRLLLLEPLALVPGRLVGGDALGLRLDVALVRHRRFVLALPFCDWHDRSRIGPA